LIRKKTTFQSRFTKRLSRKLPTVLRMAVMPYEHRWSTQMHVPADNEVMHILHGHMQLVTAHGSVSAGPGDTLLVQAGVPHRDAFDPDDPLIVFVCQFTWSLAKLFFHQVDNTQLLKMSAAAKAELAQLFDQLRSMLFRASGSDIAARFDGLTVRAWGPADADRPIAGSRLLTILLLFLRQAEHTGAPLSRSAIAPRRQLRAQELVDQTKAYIAANYAHPIGLREVATRLGTSPYHLSHVFSRESEFSFATHLREVRLTKAQELLTEEAFPVGNVARAVGYLYPNYFAKVFRKRFGISPNEFASAKKH